MSGVILPSHRVFRRHFNKLLFLKKERKIRRVSGARESPMSLISDPLQPAKAVVLQEMGTEVKTPPYGEDTSVSRGLRCQPQIIPGAFNFKGDKVMEKTSKLPL